MSDLQSVTVVPGMEGRDLYARSVTQHIPDPSETMVAGLQQKGPKSSVSDSDKKLSPIVGFLYSISRDGTPEYWPLRIGTNTLGRSKDNDIQLKEQTISDKHAVISIKKMKSTGRLIASIRDVGSKTGMFLNDEELDYDNHSCKHEDIIKIGDSYELLLLLVDVSNYNLKVRDNFMPIQEEDEQPNAAFQPVPQVPEVPDSPYSRPHRIEDGTIDMSGANYHDLEGGETKLL